MGLPFSNIKAAEIREKMNYYDEMIKRNSEIGNIKRDLISGQIYLENMCMKAVNQSIGRAIRHQNDYALVFLVDRRFENDRIKSKLPKWIKNSVISGVSKEDDLEKFIKNFFINFE